MSSQRSATQSRQLTFRSGSEEVAHPAWHSSDRVRKWVRLAPVLLGRVLGDDRPSYEGRAKSAKWLRWEPPRDGVDHGKAYCVGVRAGDEIREHSTGQVRGRHAVAGGAERVVDVRLKASERWQVRWRNVDRPSPRVDDGHAVEAGKQEPEALRCFQHGPRVARE